MSRARRTPADVLRELLGDRPSDAPGTWTIEVPMAADLVATVTITARRATPAAERITIRDRASKLLIMEPWRARACQECTRRPKIAIAWTGWQDSAYISLYCRQHAEIQRTKVSVTGSADLSEQDVKQAIQRADELDTRRRVEDAAKEQAARELRTLQRLRPLALSVWPRGTRRAALGGLSGRYGWTDDQLEWHVYTSEVGARRSMRWPDDRVVRTVR